MPITFVPKPGAVLMCDFRSDSIPPEMTKLRHAVVVSRRPRRRQGTCIVVPISTVAPNPVERFHLRIPANKYPFFKRDTDVWAKGDMVCHVSYNRLDRVLIDGKRSPAEIDPDDLLSIQSLVWEAMGRPELTFAVETVQVIESATFVSKYEVDSNAPQN